MSRTRDAGLAIGLLLGLGLLGTWRGANVEPAALLGGAGAAIGTEALAYQRPETVRALFDRPVVLAGALAIAIAGVAIGAIIAPDRSLSFAGGALASYLLLLGIASATGWAPANEQ